MVVNTDSQALVRSDVPVKIRIGDQLTQGKGVGGMPELGAKSAEESREDLYEVVRDADMVFIAGGMGGGTGNWSRSHDRADRQGDRRADRCGRHTSHSTSRDCAG